MAKKNEILLSIALEGDAEIKSKLQAVGEAGKKSLGGVEKNLGNVGKSGFGGLGQTAGKLTEALAPLTEASGLAGLAGLSGLTGIFSRLASGPAGLIAGITGVVLGMAKIGEETDKAKLKLKALGASGDTFEKLNKTAQQLGVSTESLQPSFEKFQASKNKINADQSSGLIRLRPDGATAADEAAAGVRVIGAGKETRAPVPDNVFLGALKTLIEGAQAEKISGDEAGRIADSFSSKVQSDRKLTPEAVDTLNPASQNILAKSLSSFFGGTVQNGAELKERLGRPGQRAPSDNEVFRSLNAAEPDAHKQAESAYGLTSAFDALLSATKHLVEEFSGDVGIADALGKLARIINEAADNADKIIHPRDYEPGGPKYKGPTPTAEQLAEYKKPDVMDLGKTLLTGKIEPRFADSNAAKVAKFLRDGPSFLQGTPEEALDNYRKHKDSLRTPPLIEPEQLAKTVIPSPLDTLFPKQEPATPPVSEQVPNGAVAKPVPAPAVLPPEAPRFQDKRAPAEAPAAPAPVTRVPELQPVLQREQGGGLSKAAGDQSKAATDQSKAASELSHAASDLAGAAKKSDEAAKTGEAAKAKDTEGSTAPVGSRGIVEDLTTHSGSHPDTQVSGDGSAPKDVYDLNKMLGDQRVVGEYEGDKHNEFTKSIREQLGLPSRDIEDAKQHGIVKHPNGGKADLSERLYPGGPLRYRYEPEGNANNRQPAELGSYDENMNFVPNKHQPYPRLRKPGGAGQPYSRLEDTFDTKGRTYDNFPIYNFGQPQPLDFPAYTKSLRDTLPPIPLPRPRPPELQTPISLPVPLPPELQTPGPVSENVPPPASVQRAVPAPAQPVFPPSFVPDRTPDGWLIAPQRPSRPLTPEETQPVETPREFGAAEQPKFEPASFQQGPLPPQPPALVQDIAGAITNLLNQLSERILGPENNTINGPAATIGIRGEAAPKEPAQEPATNVAALDSAASDATTGLREFASALADAIASARSASSSGSSQGAAPEVQTVQAAAGGGLIRWLDDGGHVMGPGTSTSDSIPAMLSDGEYVIRAESARKLGRGALDWLNAGHFAKGGKVAHLAGGGGLSPEWFDPDLTAEESIQLLNQTVLSPQQLKLVAMNNAKTPEESIKLLNRFIMQRHSDGGPIGHFASGGALGSIATFGDSIGHLFTGGEAADMPSLGDLSGGGGESLHPVTINFDGRPIGGLRAPTDVVDTLRKEARDSANFQTGSSPAWVHGGSR